MLYVTEEQINNWSLITMEINYKFDSKNNFIQHCHNIYAIIYAVNVCTDDDGGVFKQLLQHCWYSVSYVAQLAK